MKISPSPSWGRNSAPFSTFGRGCRARSARREVRAITKEHIMSTQNQTTDSSNGANGQFEVHDASVLAGARQIIEACQSLEEMQTAVVAAVKRNEEWRGQRCINLLA